MRFAIRDDDTCFFTQPEELERVYSRLPGFAVSLAITPFALKSEHLGDPDQFRQTGPPAPLAGNPELVAYLQTEIARRRYSALCHGFTHEYQRREGALIQECLWKEPGRLAEETRQGRAYLENVLASPIEGYVPPGNSIAKAGIEAVGATFPHILATLPLRRAGEFLFSSPARHAVFARLADQIRFGGPSLFAYSLGPVRLLACTSWTAVADWQLTEARMELARSLGADFTVAVHYWELKGRVLDGLLRLADRALALGFSPAHCGELFTSASAPAAVAPGKETQWADSKIS